MSLRDNNPRNYEIVTREIIPKVGTHMAPIVQLTVHGKLSARAKREILQAMRDGHVTIVEKVLA